MTDRTIDLDALAAELCAAGFSIQHETYGLGIYEERRKEQDGGFMSVIASGLTVRGNPDQYGCHISFCGEGMDHVAIKALSLILPHVAPATGGPAVDVVTIPRDVAARAADELEMVSREPSNWVASVNQQKADAAAIRAALEGQAAPNLHTKLLDIFNANTTSYGAGNATCSDFDGVAAADAILQLLGYPAVERQTREATPVEEGEMPW